MNNTHSSIDNKHLCILTDHSHTLSLHQERESGDTVEETEQSLEELMAQMRKL